MEQCSADITSASHAPFVSDSFSYHGEFSILEGNVLPLVREAIEECSDFVERDFGDYLSFDCRDATMVTAFPDLTSSMTCLFSKPFFHIVIFSCFRALLFSTAASSGTWRLKGRQQWLMAALRECRGFLVSASFGHVLARRYHKFWRVNERGDSS